METDFIVTDIKRVIMVGKDEYPEQITTFKHDLQSNELIFNFSGHSTVYFNGKELDNASGNVRFLPKGRVTQYEVFRHERGECIDIFFNTDRPISDVAFVINAVGNEKLSSLFKRIFAVWVSKEQGYYFEAMSLLYRIFSEIKKEHRSPKRHSDKIAPAISLIHTEFLKKEQHDKKCAILCYHEELALLENKNVIDVGASGDLEAQAQALFTALRDADLLGIDVIYAHLPPKDGLGLALYNRMIRAAAHTVIKV